MEAEAGAGSRRGGAGGGGGRREPRRGRSPVATGGSALAGAWSGIQRNGRGKFLTAGVISTGKTKFLIIVPDGPDGTTSLLLLDNSSFATEYSKDTSAT